MSWISPPLPGRRLGEDLHDRGREQVAAEDAPGCSAPRRRAGFSTSPVTFHTPSRPRLAGDHAVAATPALGHRHDRDDARAGALVHLAQARQDAAVGHQHVAEHDEERLVVGERSAAEHRVAQAPRLLLAHVEDLGESRRCRARVASSASLPVASSSASSSTQRSKWSSIARFPRPVTMRMSVDAAGDGFLDDVLDDRLVDDRQHLFGLRLGERQEPRAQTSAGMIAFIASLRYIVASTSAAAETNASMSSSVCASDDEARLELARRDREAARRACRGSTRAYAAVSRVEALAQSTTSASVKNIVDIEPTRLQHVTTPALSRGLAQAAGELARPGDRARRRRPASTSSSMQRETGDHRDRVARQRARLVDGADRRELLHDLALAAERADREAAADDLAERGEVRRDAVELLRAAERDAEARDDLVEDEHDAVLVAQRRAAPARKPGLRRDDAHVAGDRLDDDRRDLVACRLRARSRTASSCRCTAARSCRRPRPW